MPCQVALQPPPDGYRVWRGSVPAELTNWAVSLRDQIDRYNWGQTFGIWYTPPGGTAEYVIARKDPHPWSFRNGQLVTGCFQGVTLYAPIPTAALTSYNPAADTLDTPDPTAAVFDAGPTGPDWGLVALSAGAGAGVVMLFLWALKAMEGASKPPRLKA